MTACQCSSPGFCPVFHMRMGPGRFSACQGTNGWTAEKRAEYLEKLTAGKTERVTKQRKPRQPRICGGVGSHLKKLLGWFGLKERPGCKCNERAQQMNRWGPEGCRQNMGIILGWLQEEAWERGIPMSKTLLRPIVKMAIRRAEKAASRRVAARRDKSAASLQSRPEYQRAVSAGK